MAFGNLHENTAYQIDIAARRTAGSSIRARAERVQKQADVTVLRLTGYLSLFLKTVCPS